MPDPLGTKPRLDATCSRPRCVRGISGVAYTVEVDRHELTDNDKEHVTESRSYVLCPHCFEEMRDSIDLPQPEKTVRIG